MHAHHVRDIVGVRMTLVDRIACKLASFDALIFSACSRQQREVYMRHAQQLIDLFYDHTLQQIREARRTWRS